MGKASARVIVAIVSIVIVASLGIAQTIHAQFRARDPGVRPGVDAGQFISGLTADEQEMFTVGRDDFSEEEAVAEGVGPRFNFVSCAGCHAQPDVGGTSPAANPLFRVPADLGFVGNLIPSFVTPAGPVREARFQFNPDGSRDGGVHALFVITGHPSAAGRSGTTTSASGFPRRSLAPGSSSRSTTPRSSATSRRTRSRSDFSGSADAPTAAATTGRSPDSAGRRRTNRC